MTASNGAAPAGSARREELLAAAYEYATLHGLADLSLRPLANAIGSSPRVLLYLFGSKDGLVREILARARAQQLAFAAGMGPLPPGDEGLRRLTERLWSWAAAPERRGVIQLFFEAYVRSTRPDPGPWAGFAQQSLEDLLTVLQAGATDAETRRRAARQLALLRGLLLHLIAGGDPDQLRGALLD